MFLPQYTLCLFEWQLTQCPVSSSLSDSPDPDPTDRPHGCIANMHATRPLVNASSTVFSGTTNHTILCARTFPAHCARSGTPLCWWSLVDKRASEFFPDQEYNIILPGYLCASVS
ncbi:hypothetical protein SCLCIDRAFT_235225 [Scleroderma citrinum Foug A]|uniref:Uncharacterized protein n=1 Tax=Scleroderma citrinum Foug A TaxID=1036808 RepID=A0A0C2Z3X9_9AGAM|nr:hypothetical protein SCLCIDRAFT_235225 [Scleroderma citrinum Foug A]